MGHKLINLILFTHVVIIFAATAQGNSSFADEEFNESFIYRSPDERREAGLGREINNWLSLSGLVEVEKTSSKSQFDGFEVKDNPRPVASFQLGFDLSFTDWLSAELILDSEYDFEAKSSENEFHTEWEEAFAEVSLGNLDIKFGKQYFPFGEYYSYFITGPILEFGETRGNGVIIDYSINDHVEISGYFFESNIDRQSNEEEFDWGASIETVSGDESIRFGLSYLSDLSESDAEFLADFDREYDNRVSSWGAYILFGFDQFELTAETVHATQEFVELDSTENKPKAYNFELAYFPIPEFLIAARYEINDEFEEEPENQYGISMTWAPNNNINLSAEYLHGSYKNNLIFDDDDNELRSRNIFSLQLSMEF